MFHLSRGILYLSTSLCRIGLVINGMKSISIGSHKMSMMNSLVSSSDCSSSCVCTSSQHPILTKIFAYGVCCLVGCLVCGCIHFDLPVEIHTFWFTTRDALVSSSDCLIRRLRSANRRNHPTLTKIFADGVCCLVGWRVCGCIHLDLPVEMQWTACLEFEFVSLRLDWRYKFLSPLFHPKRLKKVFTRRFHCWAYEIVQVGERNETEACHTWTNKRVKITNTDQHENRPYPGAFDENEITASKRPSEFVALRKWRSGLTIIFWTWIATPTNNHWRAIKQMHGPQFDRCHPLHPRVGSPRNHASIKKSFSTKINKNH